jgi:membrane protease subunit HflK
LADALRSSFFIVKIIMAGLVLVFLGSGFFTVNPQEKAVILRFGKPVGEGERALLPSGLHWAFPRPIDEVEKIPFSSIQRAESSIGWFQTAQERAQGAEPGPGTRSLNPAGTVSYALTADTNIVHVRATLTYRITDPLAFHFDFTSAQALITNDLNNALIYVTSQFSVDDLLTRSRAAFAEQVTERVKALLEAQKLGVTVDSTAVTEANPPLYLKSKFEEVISASQKRAKAVNDAQTYATVTEAKARADATNRIYVANSSSNRLVTMVGAQADAFVKLRSQFEHDPAFFERVSQMKALEQIYTNAANKMVMSPNTHELRLNVSPEVEPPPTNSIISEPY